MPPTSIELKVSPAPRVPRELTATAEAAAALADAFAAGDSIPIELPHDPAMDAAHPSSRPPRHLPAICAYGRYELLGRLALGGMAEIFLARETSEAGSSRYLVIKRILPHVADEAQFVDMFLQEARLAMRLSHPNICHVYEFGKQDGTYFIAMEWVNGVGLGRLIRRAREMGGLPPPVAARIIAQTAVALHHAHRARDAKGRPLGIVHRDVSPQNVMVSYDGVVKLLDFGIAKAAAYATKTHAGWVKGKFAYMSPQQCQGEDIDARSDLFSLGICLYEALAGRSLYHRKTQYETMKAIIDDPVPSVRDVRPDVPPELDAILRKSLAKNPADRYENAGAMAEALEMFLADGRHVVSESRLSELLEKLYLEEIRRGPMVDSTPFGRSFERRAADEMVFDEASPLAPASARGGVSLPGLRRRRTQLFGAAAAIVLAGVIAALLIAFWPPRREPVAAAPPRGPTAGPRAGVPRPEAPPAAPRPGPPAPAAVPEPTGAETGAAGGRDEAPTAPDVDPESGDETAVPGSPETTPGPTRTAAEASRARPHEDEAPGRLDINTRPWSRVYLRGRLLGTTPIGGVRVPAGRHRLTFVDPQGNRFNRTVTVAAGRSARASFDLTRGN